MGFSIEENKGCVEGMDSSPDNGVCCLVFVPSLNCDQAAYCALEVKK